MRVLFAQRKRASCVRDGNVAFDEVLREADTISPHCPLTDETPIIRCYPARAPI